MPGLVQQKMSENIPFAPCVKEATFLWGYAIILEKTHVCLMFYSVLFPIWKLALSFVQVFVIQ